MPITVNGKLPSEADPPEAVKIVRVVEAPAALGVRLAARDTVASEGKPVKLSEMAGGTEEPGASDRVTA